jgi:hypothetical protein
MCSNDPWSSGWTKRPQAVIAHIETQPTDHQIPFATSCRALGVSESWFLQASRVSTNAVAGTSGCVGYGVTATAAGAPQSCTPTRAARVA